MAGSLRKKCTGETGVTIGTFFKVSKELEFALSFYSYYHYVLNHLMLMILTADMLDGAELGEFDPLLSCYFKCVMEKGGMVKAFFYKT